MTGKTGRARLDWRFGLGILISIAALWWALHDVDFGEVGRHMADADPLYFAAAAFMATVLFYIRAVRWKPLLEPVRPGIPYRPRIAATAIGFMANNLLPARVGEFLRAYALGRLVDVPVSAAFGSLVVERMLDALTVVAFLFAAMAAPGFPPLVGRAGDVAGVARFMLVVVVVGVVLLGAMVARPTAALRVIEFVMRPLPDALRRRILDALAALVDGLHALRSPRLLLLAVIGSIVLWLAGAFSYWLGFRAFGIDVPFSAALFLQSLVALGVSLPSAPGFFGVFESFARIGLVDIFGVTTDRAVSFAIGFHLGGFIPITLIGLWYAWRLRFTRGEMLHSEVVVEEQVEERAGRIAPGHGARDVVRESAPAKVNLRLRVFPPDGSGYHPLDTVFCALELHDDVEVRRADALTLAVRGPDPAPDGENLVLRAARAFHEAAGLEPCVAIELVKRLPVGGGLGGGSSDAAATLRALDRLHDGPLGAERLIGIGADLGSDVPFFLCGADLAHATGRGEILTPLAPLPPRPVVVVDTGIHVSTREAFGWLDRERETSTPDARPAPPPIASWDDVSRVAGNDFERVVFDRYPELEDVRRRLEDAGAIVARLSGSGACVFGVFADDDGCAAAERALEDALGGGRVLVTRTRSSAPVR